MSDPSAYSLPFTLGTPPQRPQKPGPLHGTEFVIEIVGPRSIPANAAAALLRPEWFEALGRPRYWAMAPGDAAWRPLTDSLTGSYDSLALSWPYVGPDGALSSRSVLQLSQTAERFAASVQRRAMTLPPPGEIEPAVRTVQDIQDNLDIGFSMAVVFVAAVSEQAIWQAAQAVGLTLNGRGEFVWGDPAQLTLVPFGEPCLFSLGNVQAGRTHEGLTVGFSVPRVAEPLESLKAAFGVADQFARTFRGLVISDENEPLTDSLRAEYVENLKLALSTFEQTGLVPGSAEAHRIFPDEE